MAGIGMAEKDKKFIAAHADHSFFGARLAHEEAREPHQHFVAGLVAVLIVVALEMINVYDDAAPTPWQFIAGRFKHGKITAVEASGKRIAHALLAQLIFQLFALGDVHQHSVIENFAALRVLPAISRIEHGALLAAAASNPDLEVADKALALQQIFFPAPHLRINEVADVAPAQLLKRAYSQHLQHGRIGIQNFAVGGGNVDGLLQILHQLPQELGIVQAAADGSGHLKFLVRGASLVTGP